ncbi:exonuclease domain-containing protein [Flavobacterium sp.]|uniref:3'-5' exonuclease n=1 Tax=Flavobacterium sp. TaxID=239 RepID=UPI0037514075
MIGWIKNINKKYPEFWKKYLSTFEEKSNRYVSISLGTTGLDSEKDSILSISAISIVNNTISIGNNFEINISQSDNSEQSSSILTAKKEEIEALELFLNYIENAILIGHRIYFDVEIINNALDKIDCGRLKNEAFDIEIMYKKLHDLNDDKSFSLDELVSFYKIPKAKVSTPDEAFSIALLFLKLKSKLGIV